MDNVWQRLVTQRRLLNLIWCNQGESDSGDLAHVMPQLMPRKGTAAAEALSSEEHQASSNAVELPESEMARLRQMQQRNARLFAAQKRKVQPHALSVVHLRDSVLAPLFCSF